MIRFRENNLSCQTFPNTNSTFRLSHTQIHHLRTRNSIDAGDWREEERRFTKGFNAL